MLFPAIFTCIYLVDISVSFDTWHLYVTFHSALPNFPLTTAELVLSFSGQPLERQCETVQGQASSSTLPGSKSKL